MDLKMKARYEKSMYYAHQTSNRMGICKFGYLGGKNVHMSSP